MNMSGFGITASVLLGTLTLLGCAELPPDEVDDAEVALQPITTNGVVGTLTLTSERRASYCARISLSNGSSAAVSNWTATIDVGSASLTSTRSAVFRRAGGSLTVTPTSANKRIAVGASVSFSYCANGTDRPTLAELSIVGGSVPTGTAGFATRYWDCCKPQCGWSGNVPSGVTPLSSCNIQDLSLGSDYSARSACERGTAYACHNLAPWSVSNTLSYGFASFAGAACGACYQIDFDGTGRGSDDSAASALKGKRMIVQAIGGGGLAANQFDLLIPGGGVGVFNACGVQWGTSDLGMAYGGFLTGCSGSKSCVQQKCNSVFANKPELLAGCNWFVNWFNAADIPNLLYKQVPCPAAITDRSGMAG